MYEALLAMPRRAVGLVPMSDASCAPCFARRFAQTKRFTSAVEVINAADLERFPKLLSRLLKALPSKVRRFPSRLLDVTLTRAPPLHARLPFAGHRRLHRRGATAAERGLWPV